MSDLQSMRRMSLSKRVQLAGLMLLGCMSIAWAADKAAEVSDDFLEYLGSLEGDDDNWMDFSADTASATPTVTAPATATDLKVTARDARSAAPVQERNIASKASSSAASQSSAVSKTTGKADK